MEIVARAALTFVALFILTRGLPRRTLADMAPFEMLLLVTLGDIVQQGVTQEDYSLTGSMLAVSTFAACAIALSYATWRWRRVARIVDGTPLIIVRDGVPVVDALRVERLPLDEVMEAARQHGIDDLHDVRLAILEPNGRISFLARHTSD